MVNALCAKDTLMIGPKAQTSAATTTANLDCKGADWASIRIPVAARLNTSAVSPTIGLLESDDTTVTNFATVVANNTTLVGSAATMLRYEVDLRARKRYLRLSITTATATNDDITYSAIASLTRNEADPASTTDMAPVVTIV